MDRSRYFKRFPTYGDAPPHRCNRKFQHFEQLPGRLGHPCDRKGPRSAETVVSSGISGTVTLNIVLPLAQDIEGRVVDSSGNAVPDAAVRVRYHEPGKPVRRVGFDRMNAPMGMVVS